MTVCDTLGAVLTSAVVSRVGVLTGEVASVFAGGSSRFTFTVVRLLGLILSRWQPDRNSKAIKDRNETNFMVIQLFDRMYPSFFVTGDFVKFPNRGDGFLVGGIPFISDQVQVFKIGHD